MAKQTSKNGRIEFDNPNQIGKVLHNIKDHNSNLFLCIKDCELSDRHIISLIKKIKQHSLSGLTILFDFATDQKLSVFKEIKSSNFNELTISIYSNNDNSRIDDVTNNCIIKFTNYLKITSFSIVISKISNEVSSSLFNYISESNYLNSFVFIYRSCVTDQTKIAKALKNNFSIMGKQNIELQDSKAKGFKGYTKRNKKALLKVKDFIELYSKEDKPFPSDTKYEQLYELYQRVNKNELRKLLLESKDCKFKDIAEVDDIFTKIDSHICTILWGLKGFNKSGNITPKSVLEEGQSFKGSIAFNIAKQLSIITNGMSLTAIKYGHIEHSEDCSKLSGDHFEG